MKRRKKPSYVQAFIYLIGNVRCHAPSCNRPIESMDDTIVVSRGGEALGYCSPKCFLEAAHLMEEACRANRLVQKRGNLLGRMGYGRPDQEESTPTGS
jgi:hypothetical protein